MRNCHAKIDFWGIPFEENRRRPAQEGPGRRPIDLLDGAEVTGFEALRKHLADERLFRSPSACSCT
ncbi:MAG: hypothetical protein U0835_08650 [Isosphaeraceae bacterium]